MVKPLLATNYNNRLFLLPIVIAILFFYRCLKHNASIKNTSKETMEAAMNADSIYTLLPPLVAVIIAIWRKNAVIALTIGLWLSYLLIELFAVTSTGSDGHSTVGQWFTVVVVSVVTTPP